jgi:hypothetical protein
MGTIPAGDGSIPDRVAILPHANAMTPPFAPACRPPMLPFGCIVSLPAIVELNGIKGI